MGGELHGESIDDRLGVTVDGVVEDSDGLLFCFVAGPLVIKVQNEAEVLTPDRAVERAEHLDVNAGGLLQNVLYLHAVLADDVCVVAAGVIDEVLGLIVQLISEDVAVVRAEYAECVERTAVKRRRHVLEELL